MKKIVAFTGKGGVGKTTSLVLFLKYLIESKKAKDILVIDSDPDANVADVIGEEIKFCDTIGGKFTKKPTGIFSDITTTSFYAPHHMTAAGGGGMVMTHHKNLIKQAHIFRDWGRALPEYEDQNIKKRIGYKVDDVSYDGKFTFLKMGYNFKPIELQAAFGLVQLKKLTKFNLKRAANFQKLLKFFKNYEDPI